MKPSFPHTSGMHVQSPPTSLIAASAVLVLLAFGMFASFSSASFAEAAGLRAEGNVVPVGPGSAGFGAFRNREADARAELEAAFGEPNSANRSDVTCELRWGNLGIRARLVRFGTATGNPCFTGTFVEARLNDRSWHTKSGVRPGGPAKKARKASLRRCRHDTCGVKGYALELHRIDCANEGIPGVIAAAAKGRVKALIVRWRGCE